MSLPSHTSVTCASHRIREALEGRLVDEEVSRRVSEQVEARVVSVLQSDLVQKELSGRLQRERAAIGEQV